MLAPILAQILIKKQMHSSHPYQRLNHQKGDRRGVNHSSGYGAFSTLQCVMTVSKHHVRPKVSI